MDRLVAFPRCTYPPLTRRTFRFMNCVTSGRRIGPIHLFGLKHTVGHRLRRVLWLLFVYLIPGSQVPSLSAQSFYNVIYRPAGVTYRVLNTAHFDVIFQGDQERLAREMAYALESSYEGAKAVVGLRRRLHMPVVMNAFNDIGNGYVTPAPFRMEVEGRALKGKVLSPVQSSWFDEVIPHELVHAMHAQVWSEFAWGELLSILSPDWGRILNFSVPPGIAEGYAVYHESALVGPDSLAPGRLNFSMAAMEFRAAVLSERPWRLMQLLDAPQYTKPFDRFYMGGGSLARYLAQATDSTFFHRSIRFYNRWPFFGFGAALWYGTKTPPWQIGKAFQEAMLAEEQARLQSMGSLTTPEFLAQGLGLEGRRPRWLDNQTLLFYQSGYNVRPGFYKLDIHTRQQTPVAYHRVTEDYYYSLNADRTIAWFARYKPALTNDIQAQSDLYTLDIASGHVQKTTHKARVYAPTVVDSSETWALRNKGQFNQWVSVLDDGHIRVLTPFEQATFKEIVPSPNGKTVAVLLNIKGRQGMFRIDKWLADRPVQFTPWVLFKGASVYDPSWSSDGRYMVFAADPGGIANIFSLDTQTNQVFQLTNVPFGALEPSLSPDGQTLAYVHYEHEEYRIAENSVQPHANPYAPPCFNAGGCRCGLGSSHDGTVGSGRLGRNAALSGLAAFAEATGCCSGNQAARTQPRTRRFRFRDRFWSPGVGHRSVAIMGLWPNWVLPGRSALGAVGPLVWTICVAPDVNGVR